MTNGPERPRRARLVVLYGGASAEHDVSCASAAHVLNSADRNRYQIVPVGITHDGRWMLDERRVASLAPGGGALPGPTAVTGACVEPPTVLASPDPGLPTVVFPLVHGTRGEDGTLQGLLELADVPYIGGGVLGSAICMDKAMAKTLAAAHGIAQCRSLEMTAATVTTEELAVRAEALMAGAEVDYPVFVKPANMGSSIGISKAADRAAIAAGTAPGLFLRRAGRHRRSGRRP